MATLDEALHQNLVNGIPDVGAEAVGSKVFEDHPQQFIVELSSAHLNGLPDLSSLLATMRNIIANDGSGKRVAKVSLQQLRCGSAGCLGF